jgi:MFS family permease
MGDPVTTRTDRSYAALLRVPSLARVVASMLLSRIAQSMVGVALVLFTLREYGSPALAGIVTLAYVLPGLLVSPIAGALLDRHGRIRLVILDYCVAAAALGLIGSLSLVDALPAPLLVGIAAVASLTSILSVTGLRSLFPILVPRPLWERVNAIDSNGYVVATILGPPIAAGLVALAGGAVTVLFIAALLLVATVPLSGVRDPGDPTASKGPLLGDAWAGLVYVWRNPTLRGLAVAISLVNLAGGVGSIGIPLLVLSQLGLGETAVGLAFAISGVTGMVSAIAFGRIDTRGREWPMLVIPILLVAPTVAILLPVAAAGAAGTPTALDPLTGFALIVLSQALFGLLNGPLDVALFTVRQRRTDPAIMGRAFAVSMAANYVGYPIGSALAGGLASTSLVLMVLLGIVACVVAGLGAAVLIPVRVPSPDVNATVDDLIDARAERGRAEG